ncbi:Fic family protein [Pseudarthrobacter sp. NPDC058362]|uniref:Fic family protein n=1 Tax=Pseudarthrobacter sp. NPDC058362 TaxID=3346458 RepID=UPI00365FDE6C
MKAAALLESVARFHPLIDGNKWTARTLMVLLLWINGYRHDFTTDEGFDLVAIARYPSAITLAVSAAKWSSVSFELAQTDGTAAICRGPASPQSGRFGHLRPSWQTLSR